MVSNKEQVELGIYIHRYNRTITTIWIFPSQKLFIGFKEALGYRESENKYKTVNSLGYLGKYQFGNATLKSVGIYDFFIPSKS
jgi:hypothetical protein